MTGKSVLALAVLTAAAVAQTNPPAPAAKAKLAGEFFKNVQVLKEVPVDQFIPTMQFIGASLGVDCDFCHVERAFDKDDKKEKQIARKMMLMMFAINKENFDGHRDVTCNSCHRGATKPLAIPAVMSSEVKAAGGQRLTVISSDYINTSVQTYIATSASFHSTSVFPVRVDSCLAVRALVNGSTNILC